jgi:hypothetical protein
MAGIFISPNPDETPIDVVEMRSCRRFPAHPRTHAEHRLPAALSSRHIRDNKPRLV